MLDFSQFELLTFDCYGTLINWEAGIFSVLRPLLAAHGKSMPDAELLELYGDLEWQAESGPYRTYKEVLQLVVSGFGKRFSFSPSTEELNSLADSVQHWRPWPDTVAALNRLAARFHLSIISNIDDDLFAATRPQLKAAFDDVTTAQQARCYKPGLDIFRLALGKTKVPRNRILHVGQSIFHDVLPAKSLGMATVWVNRPSPRAGIGAVKPAEGKPDLEVPDLETLARLAQG